MRDFPALRHPIILAPLAGGPGTPKLAAAVSNAGGLGFLAGGYKTVHEVRAELAKLRTLTQRSFGLNLFMPSPQAIDQAAMARYLRSLQPEAVRLGVELGQPRYDDDAFDAKLEVAIEAQVPIVSFTFGCPDLQTCERLHACGSAVWVTVTEPSEAFAAERFGADALIVQGVEAGGHRGTFQDRDGFGESSVLVLLQLLSGKVSLPLIAAGGVAGGAGIAAVLAAGAAAAQLGTAFLRCPEAGTSSPYKQALSRSERTGLTRAFTGRRARGIANRFLLEHSASAPSAYPQIHHATQPLRAAARSAGDESALSLWAGQAYTLAEERPASELVAQWGSEAARALEATLERVSRSHSNA